MTIRNWLLLAFRSSCHPGSLELSQNPKPVSNEEYFMWQSRSGQFPVYDLTRETRKHSYGNQDSIGNNSSYQSSEQFGEEALNLAFKPKVERNEDVNLSREGPRVFNYYTTMQKYQKVTFLSAFN